MFLAAVSAYATPTLTVGTPGNSLLASPTGPSPAFGTLVNFDGLTPNTSLASGTLAGQGVTSISSPNGITVIPFSTQSFPNELFDNGSNGTGDITIMLARGAGFVGIGLADSDPVSITLQALGSGGAALGPAFTVDVNASGDPLNPGNGYYVLSDTSNSIFGLRVLQASGNANYSGMAVDDLQFVATPEPGSLALLAAAGIFAGALRLRKRS